MTNYNKSRFSFLGAITAIALCVCLLMGTTYAWFTDSTASGSNVIKAGTLDVKMYWANGTVAPDTAAWADAEDGPVFNYENWEPGYTVARHLRISNEGSLAFKYMLKLVPNGQFEDLANCIDVYFIGEATAITSRDMLTSDYYVGTLKDLILDPDGAAYGILLPVDATATSDTLEVVGTQTATIVLTMRTDLGNDLQGQSIGASFDIKVIATQYNYESDDFGNDYDAGAEYPNQNIVDTWDGTADTDWYNEVDSTFTLSSAEQLAGFSSLVDGGVTFQGKTIELDCDVDLYYTNENGDSVCFEPIGSYRKETAFMGTFDGQGHTISNMSQNTWALNNGYYYGDLGLGFFGAIEDATIKNVTFDGAEISGESAICGTVAGAAFGDCTFDGIVVKNSNVADYQYYAGGIVGWASGNHTYVNCVVDASTNIAAQWGDFDNSVGGVIGGAGDSATILIKDCTVACRIDAYNDVTSSYQYYAYRRAGMLIGNPGKTKVVDGTTYADAPQLTCENVTVIYGEWANYTYCEFAGTNWPYVRVQAGVSNSAYSNPRYGHPTDADGNEVVDDNHVHNEGEDHHILCAFNQLYGGGQGVYGTAAHEGVTVEYNN